MAFERRMVSALMEMNEVSPNLRSTIVKDFVRRAGDFDINSVEAFFLHIDTFPNEHRSFLVGAIGLIGIRKAIPFLKKLIESEDLALSAAVFALASLLRDEDIYRMVGELEEHQKSEVRAAFIHCAMFCRMGLDVKEFLITKFFELANNLSECDIVRSEAIDGLSYLAVDLDRRRKSYRQAFCGIKTWLADQKPDVRASAIYAVSLHGIIECREIVFKLRTDQSSVYHSKKLTVAMVARDCIRRLDQDFPKK